MGIYEVKKTKKGDGYVFNLKASNGQVIATSQVYASLDTCKVGIASVSNNAPSAPVEDQTVEGYAAEKNPKFELYKDNAGEFRFRLKASNGQIIAAGEGYTTKANCLNGIKSIKKNAADSKTVILED